MTPEEFNEKYKDFLEEDHYGLGFGIDAATNFLDNIFKDLTQIPGFQYSQIKMKFGTCRFYSTLGAELSYLIEDKINKIVNG